MSNLLDFFDEEEKEIECDNIEPNWKKEWVGMPTFTQEQVKPYALIKVRFDNEEDLQEFAKMIGQKLTNKTKSIWHPQLVRGKNSHLQWIDEEEDDES